MPSNKLAASTVPLLPCAICSTDVAEEPGKTVTTPTFHIQRQHTLVPPVSAPASSNLVPRLVSSRYPRFLEDGEAWGVSVDVCCSYAGFERGHALEMIWGATGGDEGQNLSQHHKSLGLHSSSDDHLLVLLLPSRSSTWRDERPGLQLAQQRDRLTSRSIRRPSAAIPSLVCIIGSEHKHALWRSPVTLIGMSSFWHCTGPYENSQSRSRSSAASSSQSRSPSAASAASTSD